MIYLQNNVFDEALERLRMIFDGHDDVIVSMSGGKDSTVLFRMALMVAQERGRLPLKVFWLDQEAEWQATVDYMQHIMELPEVTPYWYQIPFEFTNTLSPEKNFISVWNPEDKAIWIHPQHPLSIKENPSSENRFHELVNILPSYCTDSENCAVLVGMRMTESLNRRVAITQHEARYKGVTWCKNKRRFLSGCRSSMERRCASAIEGAKAARSPARRTLSRAISLLGGRVSCVVIDSAAEKVLSGGGGICCGLDDPIFRLVSFLFFG